MEIFKKLIKWFGIILGFVVTNGASISLAVMNMIELGNGDLSISYWDALSSKVVCKIIKESNPNIWLPEYHWYNKVIVITLIIVGIILTCLFIYWIIKSKKTLRDLKITDKFERDKENKLMLKQEIQNEIELIESKVESGIATDDDLKKLEKLAKKLKKLN